MATQTSAYGVLFPNGTSAYARATAHTSLSFRALQDTTAPLTFDFVGSGLSFYSDGFVSLYDVTLDQYLFSYAWARLSTPLTPPPPGSSPVPWMHDLHASIALNQWLQASHIYALTLHASTNANTDSQFVSVHLSGLQQMMAPVPEPSLIALMFAGLGAVGGIAALRRRRPSSVQLESVE